MIQSVRRFHILSSFILHKFLNQLVYLPFINSCIVSWTCITQQIKPMFRTEIKFLQRTPPLHLRIPLIKQRNRTAACLQVAEPFNQPARPLSKTWMSCVTHPAPATANQRSANPPSAPSRSNPFQHVPVLMYTFFFYVTDTQNKYVNFVLLTSLERCW